VGEVSAKPTEGASAALNALGQPSRVGVEIHTLSSVPPTDPGREKAAVGDGSPGRRALGAGKCNLVKSGPRPDHFFVARDRPTHGRQPLPCNPLIQPGIFWDTAVRSQFVKKKLASEAHLIVDESLATVAPYVG